VAVEQLAFSVRHLSCQMRLLYTQGARHKART
jgi:hypothetical protein